MKFIIVQKKPLRCQAIGHSYIVKLQRRTLHHRKVELNSHPYHRRVCLNSVTFYCYYLAQDILFEWMEVA